MALMMSPQPNYLAIQFAMHSFTFVIKMDLHSTFWFFGDFSGQE